MELTNDDLNYSKNSIGETKKVPATKMLQTIQNNNEKRFF